MDIERVLCIVCAVSLKFYRKEHCAVQELYS